MSNKTYDIMKYTVLTLLPAVLTLWLSLGDIWELPNVQSIALTISAINLFLGSLVGVSSATHNRKDV
jgi:hypothetical protein